MPSGIGLIFALNVTVLSALEEEAGVKFIFTTRAGPLPAVNMAKV